MLCYAMLSYAMLCTAMLCTAMLCYAMLCYAMLCYAMLRYAMHCYAMLCYALLYTALLCTNIFYCILPCSFQQKYGQELTCKCLTHLILILFPSLLSPLCQFDMSICLQTSTGKKIAEIEVSLTAARVIYEYSYVT